MLIITIANSRQIKDKFVDLPSGTENIEHVSNINYGQVFQVANNSIVTRRVFSATTISNNFFVLKPIMNAMELDRYWKLSFR